MPAENIFAQFAQPVRSVSDYLADYDAQDMRKLQLQGAQRQNVLAALTQQQTMRQMADADADRSALQSIAAGWNAQTKPEDRIAALRNSGRPGLMTQADALEKQLLERQKTQSDVGKATSENAARDIETQAKAVAQWRDLIGMATSPEHAATLLESMHRDPRLAGTAIAQAGPQQGMAALQAMPFDQWKQQFALGAAKFIEMNKPQYITQNLGGTSRITALPGLVGAPSVASEAPITQSADNKATVGAQYANAAAAREQARATRDAARITARASDETSLRKEFADLPEVKKYKNAIPAYQAVVKAAQTNNPQADINLIYGLAKLYDPDSVVREGEYDTIANSQSIPEWLKGQAQRLAGGGKLTQATKNQIIEQANIRIGAYKSEVDGARQSYEGIARRRGLDPGNVFPEIGGQVDLTPPRSPQIKPGTVQDGYRFKGGNPADKANWEKV